MRLTNARGAGRKALPVTKTNVKATVPNELMPQWEQVENKQKFVRQAITMKLKSDPRYIPYTPQPLLIHKIEVGSGESPKYYGQTESGAVFQGASAYPDENGDHCLMRVYPGEWLENRSFYIPSVWGCEAVEKALPKVDQWHVEIRGCEL